MKTLSIVIPVYRLLALPDAYFATLVGSLKAALLVAKNQVVLAELVVVNAFPSDKLDEYLHTLMTNVGLPYLLVEAPTPIGQAQARNLGFVHTTGSFLHFIDQDDTITPNFYAELLHHNADVILAKIDLMKDGKIFTKYLKNSLMRRYEQAANLTDVQWYLLSNIAVTPGQYLLKRSIFEQAGGFPELQNRGADDWGLMFRLAMMRASLKFVPTTALRYRLHEAQGLKHLDIHASVQEFLKTIQENDLSPRLRRIKKLKNDSSWLSKWLRIGFFMLNFNRWREK